MERPCSQLFAALAASLAAALLIPNAGLFAQTSARIETGVLTADDPQFDAGEHYDRYTIDGRAGQLVVITLDSQDFDTFLQMHAAADDGSADPDREWHNDDFEESQTRSRLEVTLPDTGRYLVFVTSYDGNKTGRYELSINIISGRVEAGELAASDPQLDTGEYYDTYEVSAQAGDEFVIDLHSDQFDTYLMVRSADDTTVREDNDDHQGDSARSQVTFAAPAAGVYRIFVTSFGSGEVGRYRLTINGNAPQPDAGTRNETGALADGDQTLNSGEFVDEYTLSGRPGQTVRIELRSDDFDTYLMLVDPLGQSIDNDDHEGRRDLSVIESTLAELGEYRIGVTTFEPGESGAYALRIITGDADDAPMAADVTHIDGSEVRNEALAETDFRADDERYRDRFSFHANRGQRVVVRMTSPDFDPLLLLTGPDGAVLEFDDHGESRDAYLDLVTETTGRYRLAATSYERNATGTYALDINLGSADDVAPPAPMPVVPVPSSGRRVLGVFVGIADYPGDGSDLLYCDDDARRLHRIFTEQYEMRPEDSVLLLDAEATVDAVQGALRTIGQRAGPNDMLFFFYSGHGGQVAGAAAQAFDPDGVNETLSVHDGEIGDDEFAEIVNASGAGICLVSIDACYSGGFAKDVVSARGRMGIFSSEEDVLSALPEKFTAGGYLSRFLAEAIADDRDQADMDRNAELTAFELSHYLGERYRDEVRSTKSKGGEGYISPAHNLSFQRLVVDRGGLRHDQVLFRWGR